MTIRIIFKFEINDASGEKITDRALLETIATESVEPSAKRLLEFLSLPDDLTLTDYNITSEVIGDNK